MKTIKLFIAITLLSFITSNAQITKGNWMIGGNIGFDYSKIENKNSNSSGTIIEYNELGTYNILLEPNIAYFIKNKFAMNMFRYNDTSGLFSHRFIKIDNKMLKNGDDEVLLNSCLVIPQTS